MNALNPTLARAASAADTSSHSSTGLPSSQGLNNMFLQLLVAQLQNQSPLNPMDPTQFVGQLAQFSELSEVTQIDQILQQAIPSGSTSVPTGQSRNVPHAQAIVPGPSPLLPTASNAVSAAQHAVTAPVAGSSVLNSKIEGVF